MLGGTGFTGRSEPCQTTALPSLKIGRRTGSTSCLVTDKHLGGTRFRDSNGISHRCLLSLRSIISQCAKDDRQRRPSPSPQPSEPTGRSLGRASGRQVIRAYNPEGSHDGRKTPTSGSSLAARTTIRAKTPRLHRRASRSILRHDYQQRQSRLHQGQY
jgi:hypothetical protein